MSTLKWHFPVLDRLFENFVILAFVFGIGAITALGLGRAEIAVSLLLILLGLFGLRLDRIWMNRWPIPPSFWFSSVCIFSGGIGPILLNISGGESETAGTLSMQVGMLLGHSVFFLAYALFRPSPGLCPNIGDRVLDNLTLRKSLIGGLYILVAFGALEASVGAISGSSDRGSFGEAAASEVYGYWSYFAAFNRLTPIGFLLLPLGFRFSSGVSRVILLAFASYILLMYVASGSRYAAFTPLVLYGIGYIAFVKPAKLRAEYLMVGFLPLAAFAFVAIEHYRNTDRFQQESLSNPISKVRAFGDVGTRAMETNASQSYIIGERLIGNIDELVYRATPTFIPHAGSEGIEALPWVWVPAYFSRDRPGLVDGTRIGELYLQRALVRTSVGPSFTGDWYRRYGWLGVVIGMGLVGVIVAMSLRFIVYLVSNRPLIGIALVLAISTLVTKDANMTVSTATWMFLYDIPKYFIFLLAIFRIGRGIAADSFGR